MSLDSKSFLKGVGMGMAIGASMGMLMAPAKKKGDNVIGKALKAAGELADNISDALR
ncbi:MAG TPA: YtxH domain-containing protein [Candidatus Scatomorpha merdipullorum]|uniref:YtxH domain-containing protein n=1 Tax=Candidatus Scatomorpha merdipullorum TaxID=2840927 RepID=A0A9D1FD86_9FIRM|nr:YtxH domain-containing protein [Candidatus Scatomorpha merdipullorum]